MEVQVESSYVSKPKIKLTELEKVAMGEPAQDPVLVVNSMEAATLHCEVRWLAPQRQVSYPRANFESVLYIIGGEGTCTQEVRDGEQDYKIGTGDFVFTPLGVRNGLANAGPEPLKYVSFQGVAMNPILVDRPELLYGVPHVSPDVEGNDARVLRAGQRDSWRFGYLAKHSNITSNEVGVQYLNCGARTVGASGIINLNSGSSVPHWQNFDEIRYVVSGTLIDHQGPADRELTTPGETGDLFYTPSRVRHYQEALAPTVMVAVCGMTLATWTRRMEDGTHGEYHPNSLIYREGI